MQDSFQEENNLEEYLSRNYPEIMKAIRREGYNLDYPEFNTFHEIKSEGKTVGFIAAQRFDIVDNHFAISEAYVIPEFRGNNLFFSYLLNMFLFDNLKFFARRPTRAFVEVLLKNDYAFKLDSRMVVSYMKFIVSPDEIYTNPKIKRFYRKDYEPLPYKANLFDLDLCATMFVDPACNLIRYANVFALAEPRKYDFKKHKCRKKLKKVSEKFLDERYDLWDANEDIIKEFALRQEREWDEFLSVENLIGSEDELIDDFIFSLESFGLTVDDGFRIRQHVLEGLKSGQLSKTSYWQRAVYLLDNFDDIDRTVDEIPEDPAECPFCGMPVLHFLKSCMRCGFSLRDIDFEEHAFENMGNVISQMRNEVEIGQNDELADLKEFYNRYMNDYDFDELAEFYRNSDEGLEIKEIADGFCEHKLDEAIGAKSDFIGYMDYLLYHISYDMDKGDLDGAFVHVAQFLILVSNRPGDESMVYENPEMLFGFKYLDDLVKSNHPFDVDALFKQAAGTFRISGYNNNHEEILYKIKMIFEEE